MPVIKILMSAVITLNLFFSFNIFAAQRITLEQAHRLALENNYNIRNVKEVVHQADLQRYKAWSLLMPNLSATGSLTLNDQEIKMQGTGDTETMIKNAINEAVANALGQTPPDPIPTAPAQERVIQERWDKSLGITANMALINPVSIPTICNSYDSHQASIYSGQHTRNELLFAVTQTYYTVLSAMESVKVAERDLENAQAFLDQARKRKDVGAAVEIEVLRAEIEQLKTQETLDNAKDSLKIAKTALAYLTGIDNDFEIAPAQEPQPADAPLDELQDMALSDRADLKATRLQLEVAERSRLATWLEYVPAFDATYNYAWNSATGYSGDNTSWRLIFGARWSLFDGGSRIAEIYERSSQIRQITNNLNQMKLDIKEEVETAQLELERHRRNLELADKQLILAEDNHTQVKKRYEQGLATSLDVLDANTTLSQAEMNLVIERLQYQLAVLKLNKSIGRYSPLAVVK